MTLESLSFINSCLDELGIQYQFMEWTSTPIPDPFWVGEYTEVEPLNEDGLEESTFILTGTTRNKYIELESVKQKLKEYFPTQGKTAILESGSGIAVFYSDSHPVPSIQEGIHRFQVNLKIKEWRC
jgi:hypothetical protein